MVSPGDKVVVKVGGDSGEVFEVTVLKPVPLESAGDEALENSFGVSGMRGDIEVEVVGFNKCFGGNASFVDGESEVKEVD